MPRSPIRGRFCHNRRCHQPIDPGRPKGTKYCDSSCRSEEARLRFEDRVAGEGSPNGGPPVSDAEERSHAPERRPRAATPYCVLRRVAELGLIGGFEVIGFAAETNKGRAIRKIAAGREGEFVAVSVHNLKLYDGEGVPLAEAEPEWVA